MTNYRQTMAQTLEFMNIMREYKLIERELTDAEIKRREEIAQEMDDSEFKSRYGERWKEVKMAVATQQAKNEHKGKKPHKHPHPEKGPLATVDEAASWIMEAKYDIYHKTFSDAMQHAYKAAKKMYGITVNPSEIDDKVATGPSKPSAGKTNRYQLKGDKGTIQVQVANLDNKKYELNMYKEEINLDDHLDEAKIAFRTKAKDGGEFVVLHRDTKGMRGSQDKFLMRHLKKGKVKELGSHVSVDGAKKFAKNQGIIEYVELDEFTISDLKGMGIKPTPEQMKELQKISNKNKGNITRADLKKVGIKEEVEIDEGSNSDVIVMGKGRVTKSVLPDAKKIKELEKDGWRIQGVIEKGSSVLKKDAKAVMKAIKGGDKLGIGEAADMVAPGKVVAKNMMMVKSMKPYASKVAKMKTVSGIDLERMLPHDKVSVKEIDGVMSKSMNEEVDLDEGKMNQMHQMMKDGKSAEQIAKAMKLDLKTVRELMKEGLGNIAKAGAKAVARGAKGAVKTAYKASPIGQWHGAVKTGVKKVKDVAGRVKQASQKGEEFDPVEEGAAADARRAIGRDPQLGRKKDSADDDMSATDDDVKAASKNIMMQLRKSQTLRGKFDVEFMDRKKHKVPPKIAQAVTARFMALKRPAEKQEFQNKISKSYKDMLKALDEAINNEGFIFVHKKQTILERIDGKLMERKNG